VEICDTLSAQPTQMFGPVVLKRVPLSPLLGGNLFQGTVEQKLWMKKS